MKSEIIPNVVSKTASTSKVRRAAILRYAIKNQFYTPLGYTRQELEELGGTYWCYGGGWPP
jgi:hypothetical protein